ncbi:MAG: hypothetical protein IPL52_10265 [Flavobacteriales bacterium]|nr:hypothetical protein [Flavobacteriales bacterium]
MERNGAAREGSAAKLLAADGVKAANSGIAASELIETNAKTVNDVYLATIGKDVDEFTATQASELFDIADQCPMLGGNAVFKARSLYWLIDDTYDFDDASLCLPYGIVVKRLLNQHNNTVSVVPNPATDEATLVLTRTLEQTGAFVLYDALGAEILRFVVPTDQFRIPFSTAALVPALYHYQVRGSAGIVGEGKLAIIR